MQVLVVVRSICAMKDYALPGDIVVPRGTVLHREMMQCWVPRERITCMPLALFHDFDDGAGPVAVVPELQPHDVLIWRTGHVLHGALTAAVRGNCMLKQSPWDALGLVVVNGKVCPMRLWRNIFLHAPSNVLDISFLRSNANGFDVRNILWWLAPKQWISGSNGHPTKVLDGHQHSLGRLLISWHGSECSICG